MAEGWVLPCRAMEGFGGPRGCLHRPNVSMTIMRIVATGMWERIKPRRRPV
ncbi:hypothetical protein [Phyllobacterium salinisoli]|uniref:hypothetical protein n=1 Tax=Phyllobacterium salinisoli TaxID=1899321 RepID=UPI00190F435A|nr:hypothetical protein [Phyllobacterium salinisoli]